MVYELVINICREVMMRVAELYISSIEPGGEKPDRLTLVLPLYCIFKYPLAIFLVYPRIFFPYRIAACYSKNNRPVPAVALPGPSFKGAAVFPLPGANEMIEDKGIGYIKLMGKSATSQRQMNKIACA